LTIVFEKIMEEYSGVLSRVANTYEANAAIQQELFQEICVAIWQALNRYKGDANIKTYILKIAHNRCISHVSKEVTQFRSHSDEDAAQLIDNTIQSTQFDTEKVFMQSQQVQQLLSHIRDLPMPNRQVISLSLEGLSYDEIAEITGLKTNHVGVAINRIKQQLRGAITHE
jgi:RNA polymerase sigma factor (sigma-70 family)